MSFEDGVAITQEEYNQEHAFFDGAVHIGSNGYIFKKGVKTGELTHTERLVIALLAKHPKKPVEKESILDLWTYHLSNSHSPFFSNAEEAPNISSAGVYLYKIRQKIGQEAIQTRGRQGFILRSDAINAMPSQDTWYALSRGDNIWRYNYTQGLLVGATGYNYLSQVKNCFKRRYR